MDATDNLNQSKWYAQHPLVSTFLWLIGNTTGGTEAKPYELPRPSSNTRLQWKDEMDGGKICEVIIEESDSGKGSPISRQNSSTALKRSESGKLNLESRIFQNSAREYGSDADNEVTESPQWGWYVSTTPPSRDNNQLPSVDPNAVKHVVNIRGTY